MQLRIHHISLPCSDLEASRRFYIDVVGLTEFERPKRAYAGAWFRVNDVQEFHLIHANPSATYRSGKTLDNDDVHFAIAVDDCATMLDRLRALGYSEQTAPDAPLAMIARGVHGFVQIFIHDPDRHVIEFNSKFEGVEHQSTG
jgi:glyoxylase I family protein